MREILTDIQIIQDKSFFLTVIDAMPDLVRVVDREGYVILANQSIEAQFGVRAGDRCYDCLGLDRPCEDCVRKTIFETGLAVNEEKNVQGRTYSLRAAPIADAKGAVQAVVEVFRDMTEYATLRRRLISGNMKMMNDLAMARRLQRSIMNKKLPEISGYRLSSGFYPCEAIGGDALDCIRLSDGRVLLYVADVSGHGVRAAMLTIFIKQEISFLSKESNLSLTHMVDEIERSFLELDTEESSYITLFLALLNPKTGEIEYENVGHSIAPLIYREGEIEELFLPGAPICRWATDASRRTEKTHIFPGQRLLLLTDGVIGAHSPLRSVQNLKEEFMREPFSAKVFIRELRSRMTQDFVDDIVLLICERF